VRWCERVSPVCLVPSPSLIPQGWSLKTYRRLKNVIVVLDVVPELPALTFSEAAQQFGKNLTPPQEESLFRAFRLFDADNDGLLTYEEVRGRLMCVRPSRVPQHPPDPSSALVHAGN
jgi:hypothetical protein